MKLAFALVLGLVAPAAMAQTAAPKPGHYCLRTDIGVADNDEAEVISAFKVDGGIEDRSVKLGKLGVDLDITESRGRTLVSFSNYMPDNGQIVRSNEPAVARKGPDGSLTFTFTDNWKAPGKGEVRTEGDGVVLVITRTRPATTFAGQYSDRQFGEFKLNPGTCPPYK